MSKQKRLISLFLVFAMLFSLMLPVTASASGSSASKSHAHVYKQLPGRSLYSPQKHGRQHKNAENVVQQKLTTTHRGIITRRLEVTKKTQTRNAWEWL